MKRPAISGKEWKFVRHDPNTSKYLGNIEGLYETPPGEIQMVRTITIQLKYGTEEEQEANAKMMAAALKMSLTLEKVLDSIKGMDYLNSEKKLIKDVLMEAGYTDE